MSNLLFCADDRRSAVLRAPAHPLNGIDYVEYRRAPLAPPGQQLVLDVTFLKPPPAGLTPASFTVIGGVRIVGVQVTGLQPELTDPLMRHVFVDREGDFSFYVLAVSDSGIDDQRSQARFSFKAGCPSPLDCRVVVPCPTEVLAEPSLDYLAKDYQSFRRLLLDLIAQRNPGWQERMPADLGITLVELFAYAGDLMSYAQDAGPVTESFLDTCLHRISAARHARLIDYTMHNGRNAATFVHFTAVDGTDGVVPAGAKLLTRVGTPLIGAPAAPGPVLPDTADFSTDPALARVTVFEAAALVRVTDKHNALMIHTWDDALCCLGIGTREAFLYGISGTGAAQTALLPELKAGDFVLLEEVLSPVTGAAADRNPNNRQVVRLVSAVSHPDLAFTNAVPNGVLTPRTNPAFPPLPLLHVVWQDSDALTFPLCLSAQTATGAPIAPVSMARGNVTPADHGRTVTLDSATGAVALPDPGSGRWPLPSLSVPRAPLTFQAMPAAPEYDAAGRLLMGRTDLTVDATQIAPAVLALLGFPGGLTELWTPVPHLLNSGPFDQVFVAEVDNAGNATLRFGDDQYGRRPLDVTHVTLRQRIGNGKAGNLGAGALVHIVTPDPADPLDPSNPGAALTFATVAAIYQPLVARYGTDPQTVEQVRQWAPEAFRAVQYRAVTEADWDAAALTNPAVAAAKTRFRWTGSWYTVFLAIQPVDTTNLIRLPGGGADLALAFQASLIAFLTRYKLAGYELAVRAAVYVPLEVDLTICVAPGHFRGDVLAAVLVALSNRVLPDGTRGFFHPLNFGFGQAVYLSRLYAAVEAIEGVESATATVFRRYWEVPHGELQRGVIPMADMEIPRLDNDPNFPEAGVLTLTAVGGQ